MNYKVGDKVKVKSLEWYNDKKNKYGGIDITDEMYFESNMSKFCGGILTIKHIDVDLNAYKVEENDYYWSDEMFEGLAGDTIQPVVFENIVFPNENYADKVELCLGNDYEIVVEDGRTFVQRKKPKYPTTYEECRKVLGIEEEVIVQGGGYKHSFVRDFYKLLICRDAYWKIAGEKMGLDKPWKQDYDDRCFIIANNNGNIHTYKYHGNNNVILAFPTAEMRDAFYENFKCLIEDCKELL